MAETSPIKIIETDIFIEGKGVFVLKDRESGRFGCVNKKDVIKQMARSIAILETTFKKAFARHEKTRPGPGTLF